jgi:protein NEDD1
VRGIAFSPLNKLLLASVSLDKSIIFYDIQKSKKVSGIVAPDPLQSIAFNSDGHTVAVGSLSNAKVYVYDLRNQSRILCTLAGHGSTVNSLSFMWPEESASKQTAMQAKKSANAIASP